MTALTPGPWAGEGSSRRSNKKDCHIRPQPLLSRKVLHRWLFTALLSACAAESTPASTDVPPLPVTLAAPAPGDVASTASPPPPGDVPRAGPPQPIDGPAGGASDKRRPAEREKRSKSAAAPSALPPGCDRPGIHADAILQHVERLGGSGIFEDAIIAREFKKRMRAVHVCYEQQLYKQVTLQGSVLGEFTIEPAGIVTHARITGGSANNAALADCVRETVKRFRYDPGPVGGTASYRFSLSFTTPDGDPFRCFKPCGLEN
jgi:TonB family protein